MGSIVVCIQCPWCNQGDAAVPNNKRWIEVENGTFLYVGFWSSMQNLDVDLRPAVDPQNQHALGTGTESFLIKKDKDLPTLVVGLPAYLQASRAAETPEEREARLLKRRTAKAASLLKLSPEEREDRCLEQRAAASARYHAMLAQLRTTYNAMLPEQKEALLAQKRTAYHARVPEQKEALLAQRRTAYHARVPEQKEAASIKRRLADAARYHAMSPELRKAASIKKRTANAARRNAMNPEQKEALLAKKRTARAARKNAMNPEQKIAHKNKRRLAQSNRRKNKKNRALPAASSSLM